MHTPQKDAVDPQINEQLNALCKKLDEAYNNSTGPIYGREAIEKYDADVFKQVHFSNDLDKCDQYGAHIIGTYRDGWQ
jgi:hypothetical protein